MHPYLIDEYPIMVYPTLAQMLGLNESIFLQVLHGWLESYQKSPDKNRKIHWHDGRWWAWGTPKEWKEGNIPFLSESTIRRAIKSLRDRGIIVVGNYNKRGYDKTNWYSIDYKAYDALFEPSGQNEPVDEVKMNQSDEVNLTRPIPSSSANVSSNTAAPTGVPESFPPVDGKGLPEPTPTQAEVVVDHARGEETIPSMLSFLLGGTPTHKEEITTPGLRAYRPTTDVRVVEIEMEPEDTTVTCPDCDHSIPWPHGEQARRRSQALTCPLGDNGPMDGCGARFIIQGYKRGNGRATTYRHPEIPRDEEWVIELDDPVPSLPPLKGKKQDVTRFVDHWRDDSGLMVEKMQWAAGNPAMLQVWGTNIVARLNKSWETASQRKETVEDELDFIQTSIPSNWNEGDPKWMT